MKMRTRSGSMRQQTQQGVNLVVDVVAWAVGVIAAVWFRFDLNWRQITWPSVVGLICIVVVVQVIVGIVTNHYSGRYTVGTFEEIRNLGIVVLSECVVLGTVVSLVGTRFSIPRSTIFLAAPIALAIMLAVRLVERMIVDQSQRPDQQHVSRALIYGAGYVGNVIVRRMLTDPRSPYLPVGLLDDDHAKRNAVIRSVKVLGQFSDLTIVARKTQAKVLLVAFSDPEPSLMEHVLEVATPLGIEVKVVPTLAQTLGRQQLVGSARDVSVEDLIGRKPMDLNVDAIAGYLMGKRVLVTGAGGSIGQELCNQIHGYAPAALIMLDHDETHLQDTEFTLFHTGLLQRPEIVLADLRDLDAVQRVFQEWKPEVVFHAAALKHVPMLQRFPEEAWETNVMGTLNVLLSAREVGVKTFVNISTDKAADPTTILGWSKRTAERLTAWVSEEAEGHYCSVRFGNVFGSRGSMVPLFRKAIESGGPITLTHKDATRYFMTIPQACQLVIQAGAMGDHGDVMILDMGEPVKIIDVAQRMIDMSGHDCDIEITGLREGEKIHEVLMSKEELGAVSSPHTRISRASVPPLDPINLDYDGWLQSGRYLK